MITMDEPIKQAEVTPADLQFVHRRLDRMSKQLRVIIAVLVEKKIIGDALQKAIEESKSDEELIDWFMKEIQKS